MLIRNEKLCILILLLGIVVCLISGCHAEPVRPFFDINAIHSYRDIPGVTDEEIAAIETIKASRRNFTYGSLPATEAFVQFDGNYGGFTALFCDLLSDLFGIPFVHDILYWDSLKSGLDNETIDFNGDLTPTPERKQVYFMSLPIAERSVRIFTHENSVKIETVADVSGLRIGFSEGTITAQSILNSYPWLEFEIVYVKNVPDAAEKLESGFIDAFVEDSISSFSFSQYSSISSKEFFPLVLLPISMTTRNPELKPIIDVVDKYMEAGGIHKLQVLYSEGSQEYARYILRQSLTSEERAYITGMYAKGEKIPIALEPDNYPVCFYNEKEDKFQGIAVDILSEISLLTGLEFNNTAGRDTSWRTMFDQLRSGEVSLVSELLYSEERKSNFLWSLPYASSNYVLLSRFDYPFLETNQIILAVVGILEGSANKDMFNMWFPQHPNVKYYLTQIEIFDALDRGEIDLAMTSESLLLTMTNYLEKPGYKVNVYFNEPREESSFGLNINESQLCSILDKSMQHIKVDKIERSWKIRVFDYSRKYAVERSGYLLFSAGILLMLSLLLGILFIKNNKTRVLYRDQMVTLSTMYKSIPDMVFSKDLNGKYTSCNNTFEEFFEVTEPDIIGKTTDEIYSADIIAAYKVMAMDKKVLHENSMVKDEIELKSPDMSQRLIEIIKVPLLQNGKPKGLLGIGKDITEHKEAEKAAQEASRAKSNFLAKMSHEIRTPMNAIIGMAELALREHELGAAHKHILTVKQAGAHLLSIINDILDFSKIEMGKFEIITGDYLFSSLINDVISIIRMRVMDSQIRFAVNIDSKIPNNLVGDETRLRQVLLNILNNAVKYTEKGFVSFTAHGEQIDDDTINLVMEVMDSGKGIRKEDVKKIFGDYIQVDQDKNRGIEGVGLGLAITRNIVRAMNGDIDVYSEYGSGSTFTVTIPQKIHSPELLARVENPETKNVLIYERREIYANSIASNVDNLGVYATLVSSDDGFLEKISANKYNFIFISYSLLDKNKDNISRYARNAKVVVLSDFGEAIPDKNLSILAMPVYSISIANILNGHADGFSFSEEDEHIVRFTAPEARILIVDDINTNLKVAEGLLLPYKMKIDLCLSGREAIEAVKNKCFDLIFMDHKMPDMDGIETTDYIRSLGDEDPYFKNIPIIILTANAVSGAKEMFLKRGFDDFLSKPIDTVKLNSVLEKWIPKEKQYSLMGLNSGTGEPKASKPDIGIEGIDEKKGIMLSGGTMENYLGTLSVYYKDGLKKIEELNTSLDAGNLQLYTIQVHALKSASANIGADGLSEAAKALEMAGEEKNISFINANNPGLLKDLELLLFRINRFLSSRAGNGEKGGIDTEELIKSLLNLKKALVELDAGSMNQLIDNLQRTSCPDDVRAVFESIAERIITGEYDEAVSLIDKLLEEKFDGKN